MLLTASFPQVKRHVSAWRTGSVRVHRTSNRNYRHAVPVPIRANRFQPDARHVCRCPSGRSFETGYLSHRCLTEMKALTAAQPAIWCNHGHRPLRLSTTTVQHPTGARPA